MAKNFALIGVGGYIAPRHLRAIRDTGNNWVASLDPSDSVGIIDSFFPETRFFTDFERFDRHMEKLRRLGDDGRAHYVTICSPNYLHDAHARFALRINADAICEKPVVLNPWNIDALQEIEDESGHRIYTILQLRVHPALVALKQKLRVETSRAKKDVCLTYITSRGAWYLASWKGRLESSGGLATNIGIHFFDLLIWLFGAVENFEIHVESPVKTAGFLELKHARVKWYLSIDKTDLPDEIRKNGQTTFRSITIDGGEVEFSEGFTDLHTVVYKEILAGKGFGLSDAKPSVQLAHDIREAKALGINSNSHPILLKR